MTLPAVSVIQATQAASAKMADRHTPFVYDDWYVAAFTEEVGAHLLARTLLGRGIVLYRDNHGKVVAMEDRCPHRSMPLSAGELKDDHIMRLPRHEVQRQRRLRACAIANHLSTCHGG